MTTTQETFTLPIYQSRTGKARESGVFRAMTFQEVLDLAGCQYVATLTGGIISPSHIWFLTQYGDARQAKLNGKVRTWKRDLTRIEIPCKYGLYEYFTLDKHDIEQGRLLVRID